MFQYFNIRDIFHKIHAMQNRKVRHYHSPQNQGIQESAFFAQPKTSLNNGFENN